MCLVRKREGKRLVGTKHCLEDGMKLCLKVMVGLREKEDWVSGAQDREH